MALETGTYISDLVTTNPVGTDTIDKADDHLRLLKTTVKNTFPNITGAVTPTHTQLNYVTGVTSAIQTQLDAKYPLYATNTAGITAGTNAQGQGALTTDLNVVSTTAANPSGVTLPTATAGRTVKIANRGTNPIAVFPATGAAINGLAANASIQIAVGGEMEFWASSATQWYATNVGSITQDASGNVGIGGSSPGAKLEVSGASGSNQFAASVATAGGVVIAVNNAGTIYNLAYTSGGTPSTAYAIGAQSNIPVSLLVNNVEKAKLDTSGNFLITSSGGIGYGTGSGGAVTQLTSKSTGVTLNKTNGSITMNSAALAASARVGFTFTNSTISASDVVIFMVQQGSYTAANYRVEAYPTSGNCVVYLTNISGGSLSDAVVINFAVIKAVTA